MYADAVDRSFRPERRRAEPILLHRGRSGECRLFGTHVHTGPAGPLQECSVHKQTRGCRHGYVYTSANLTSMAVQAIKPSPSLPLISPLVPPCVWVRYLRSDCSFGTSLATHSLSHGEREEGRREGGRQQLIRDMVSPPPSSSSSSSSQPPPWRRRYWGSPLSTPDARGAVDVAFPAAVGS